MIPSEIDLRTETQQSAVADEVSALIAIIRPILIGLLYSLQDDIVLKQGGHSKIDLQQLGRLRRQGDGDCGICYEYAVHDAIRRGDAAVIEKISDALKKCKVPGYAYESILFGAEKTGAQQLIATAKEILTDDSRLLTGKQSQPPKLKNYLSQLSAAFRRPTTRASLPSSINGLWKADLFLGCKDSDRWIGTSVKINPKHLEGAAGLRVGIVPSQQGRSDKITMNDTKNLIVCPLPYDGEFVEMFYHSWSIVQQFLAADATLPKEVNLPQSSHRQVARELAKRRDFPVLEVINALEPLAQPHLLETKKSTASLVVTTNDVSQTSSIISPIPRFVKP